MVSTFVFRIFCHDHSANNIGDDIWRYVGKLTEAQRSMLDDRFKWKVLCFVTNLRSNLPLQQFFKVYLHSQAREMEKRKEGRPGEARAALRRSVRDNVYVFFFFIISFNS